MPLQGKVGLVTGGAQGIGLGLVESLLEAGAVVSLCDWNKEVGTDTVEKLREKYGNRCIFLHCDVTDDKQFEDCFKTTIKRFNCIDIVVNNAGSGDENEPGWRKVINLNITSVIVGTKLGFKYMSKENGGNGGTVVNIASITSLYPFPSIPVYSATKAAVNQYSRSVGSDLYFKKTGVKVIALNPGMTETPLALRALSTCVVQDPEVMESFANQFGSFPFQKPSDVGRGLIQILENGENGTLWLVNDSKPAELINPQ